MATELEDFGSAALKKFGDKTSIDQDSKASKTKHLTGFTDFPRFIRKS